MKSKVTMLIVLGTGILFYLSCSDNTVSPEVSDSNIEFKAYQSSSCLSDGVYKLAAYDSSFSYTFSEELLIIDLHVTGNCCPDSNRFTSSYYINADTIYTSVVDTAQSLCDCTCSYQVHLEYSGLTKSEYVFYCEAGSQTYNETVHN